MGTLGQVRARGATVVAAVVLAMAGCVGPAALTPLRPADDADPGLPTESATGAGIGSAGGAPVASAAAVAPTLGDWHEGQGLAGVDVSRDQDAVDWAGLAGSGHAFAYVRATEGTGRRSPLHDEQRAGARRAGLMQGAYHAARPAQSSGTLQARFFAANGGSWAPDGMTLPGALELGYADEGDRCHGLGPTEMVEWLREFSDEYRRLTGRIPVMFTSTEVWRACTGDAPGFGDHPLWLYDHGEVPGDLPAGWDRPALWQRSVVDHVDGNVFFGTMAQLLDWASAPLR